MSRSASFVFGSASFVVLRGTMALEPRVRQAIEGSGFPEIRLFGHVGDGNLHINAMKPDAMLRQEWDFRAARRSSL